MPSKSTSTRHSKQSPDCRELLVMELQQIHHAEAQLSRMLPRLGKAAQSENLRRMLEQRQEQGERLQQEIDAALEELEESPGRRRNTAAEGLISDVREHIQETQRGPALDEVLIAGIQKTEHYCIAAWGTAKALAQANEEDDVVEAMDRALEEGKKLDQELTQLAEKEVTPALLSLESGEEEGSEEEEGEEEGSRSNGGRSRKRESQRRHAST
jgi:ferritin-like metal-binding protein YciE